MTQAALRFEVVDVPYTQRKKDDETHRLVACSEEGPLMFVTRSEMTLERATRLMDRLNGCSKCAEEALRERKVLHACIAERI